MLWQSYLHSMAPSTWGDGSIDIIDCSNIDQWLGWRRRMELTVERWSLQHMLSRPGNQQSLNVVGPFLWAWRFILGCVQRWLAPHEWFRQVWIGQYGQGMCTLCGTTISCWTRRWWRSLAVNDVAMWELNHAGQQKLARGPQVQLKLSLKFTWIYTGFPAGLNEVFLSDRVWCCRQTIFQKVGLYAATSSPWELICCVHQINDKCIN